LEKKGIKLSAANSVNFGRIIFQIIYHIKSYLDLIAKNEIKNGEKIYIIVPSGNFGNALGAYYAKKMGVPIEKIIIASNENNVLTQLINGGDYDIKDKKLILTTSPAMDILKSSNVERVLFDMFGGERTRELMNSLDENHSYKLTAEELEKLQIHFVATYSKEDKVKEAIKNSIDKNNYIIDPHTATAIKAYEELREKDLKTVICSTAEWTKFAPTVANTQSDKNITSDLDALDFISNSLNVQTPQMIANLFDKEIKHSIVVEQDKIEDEIFEFLK
jgi:threonine synthase